MTKLFDHPVVVRSHPHLEGVQWIYRYPNGYGASIVRSKLPFEPSIYSSYTSSEKEWELAVIRFKSADNLDFELDYTTPITDDVIGHLIESEVEKILQQIAALPAKDELKNE